MSCSPAPTPSFAEASSPRSAPFSTSRPHRSTTGCRRFRRRSISFWRSCSQRILQRGISPSATSAARLRRLSVDLSSAAPVAPPVVEQPTGADSSRLIGRDAERAQLLQSLNHAKSGRGSLILLLGDAGVGKTRLAEEGLAAARRLGFQTLVGRCYEQEGTPALIPYIEVLEEASRLMSAAAFRQAIRRTRPSCPS